MRISDWSSDVCSSDLDMVLHCVAHLVADGDLAGGLRNLWDFHCLLEDFGSDALFLSKLEQRAVHHQLASHLQRAIRLSDHLYGMGATLTLGDRLYEIGRAHV